jgi:photosystem II stability/assembly factor-like uncharacterized protein
MAMLLMTGCQDDLLETDDHLACYAAAYSNGIYATDNGGNSWFPVDTDQKKINAYFKRIYLDPDNRDKLYITTTGAGLFELDMSDISISGIAQLADGVINSLAFPSAGYGNAEDRLILAGLNAGGVLKTADIHGPWQRYNDGLTYRDVNVLYSRGRTVFAGTVNDLFIWDESLKRWVTSSGGIKNRNIISIASEPGGKAVYAGSGPYSGEKGRFENIPSLYKSIDSGKTWVESGHGIQEGALVYVITINPGIPERIYLGTSSGIYRSIDSGDTWVHLENGLPEDNRVFDIKIARMPGGRDIVYAAGSKGVFMTMDDDEASWVNKSYGLEKTAITSIVLMPG